MVRLEGSSRPNRCSGEGLGQFVEEEIDRSDSSVTSNDKICSSVSRSLIRAAFYPADSSSVSQFLGRGNWLVSKVRVRSSELACDPVDRVTTTMDACGLIEYAVFRKDLVDGCSPTRRIVFAEDVGKIAGQ
jgi:hypothetical protein